MIDSRLMGKSRVPAQAKRLPAILEDLETEPYREDWLLLSPGERLLRSWAQRRQVKDLEAAHDERSLPQL